MASGINDTAAHCWPAATELFQTALNGVNYIA
jgi:hypothetical protein